MPRKMSLSVSEAKKKVLDALSAGDTVANAMKSTGRALKTHENWRAQDPEYAAAVDHIFNMRRAAKNRAIDEDLTTLTFAEWRKRFLGRDTYPHQQAWIDLIEGREYTPRRGEIYEPSDPRRIIINVPPFHPAEVSTPILTDRGWTTVGDVTEDDMIIGEDGYPAPVLEIWEPGEDVDLLTVKFNTGDEITTDARHLWEVTGTSGQPRLVTTAWLMENPRYCGKTKWRVNMAKPVQFEPRELPLDPYLLGAWLGDGTTGKAAITVSDADYPHLAQTLEGLGLTHSSYRDGRGVLQVYVRGIRRHLPATKQIPADYMLGSVEQRLVLLQGLMDTDGTINPRDGRASFIQVDGQLAHDVYRLVASLGMQPRIRHEKQGATAPNGKPSSDRIWRVYFKPNGEQVFRLPRKQQHVKHTAKGAKTNNRTIDSVVPAGRGKVRCFTALTDGNKFLIGDGLIPTRNAKSTTITQEYVTYRICMDPNIRVIVVSKTQQLARKFLYAIKQRLTSNQWSALQAAYAPSGGFRPDRADGSVWSADKIYVNGIESGERDPTVEALGMGGQIYGARADLIILDDCVVGTNANEYEKQITWLEGEVESRVKNGSIVIIGTRLATVDLYGELRDGDRYLSGKTPWTYLAQPIVLEFAEDPKDWKTLWPYSSTPMETGDTPLENGMYVAFDGPTVARLRDKKPAKTWSLVYMQSAVADNSTFAPECVMGSVQKRRKPGRLSAGAIDHPPAGMEGMYVILSIDPASAGDTFLLVEALDKVNQMRYVLNAWTMTDATISQIHARIEQIHSEFRLNELIIEESAFQKAFVHDERLRDYCRDNSIILRGHYTGRNKLDPDFGVASVAALFGYTAKVNGGAGRSQFVAGSNRISLPDPDYSSGVKLLIDELIAWVPGVRGKNLRQDGPMALWFAEIRVREILQANQPGKQESFRQSRWTTRRSMNSRAVINLSDYLAAVGE